MSKTIAIVFFAFNVILFSCGSKEMKFDKKKWNEKNDMFYANRERMVNDLMKNHLKIGMNYYEVINLLGMHSNDSSFFVASIAYEISVDYGWNIDPQEGKTLYLEFSKDSILNKFWLEKWEHQ